MQPALLTVPAVLAAPGVTAPQVALRQIVPQPSLGRLSSVPGEMPGAPEEVDGTWDSRWYSGMGVRP